MTIAQDSTTEQRPTPMCFVDARRRVRALLQPRGDDTVLVFYDETGAERETVRGLLLISATLLRMLGDPKYHPEIVGQYVPTHSRETREVLA